MTQQARRGFMPTDERDFGDKALPTLRKAAEEVYYLLNRNYPISPITRFIGDHYQLSERQRLALTRTISSKDKIIASSDSIILDECNEWFNLAKYVVDMQYEDYPYSDIIPD